MGETVLVTFDPVNFQRLTAFLELMEEKCHDIGIIWSVSWQSSFATDVSDLFDSGGAVDKPSKVTSML
jgi:hypothetical protein